MSNHPNKPHRLSQIFQSYAAPVYLVTFCTADRVNLLANDSVHAAFCEYAEKAAPLGIAIGRYVIMPDHIHLFCTPAVHEYPTITKWIKYWKTLVSRQWPNPAQQPIWQQNFWDTQLRTDESYSEKWNYVKNNPVRHGLVTCADQWKFQGELESLFWHD